MEIGCRGAEEKHVRRQFVEAGSLACGLLEPRDDIAPPVTTVRDPVLEQGQRGQTAVRRAVRQRAFECRGSSEVRLGEKPPDLELRILTIVEPPEQLEHVRGSEADGGVALLESDWCDGWRHAARSYGLLGHARRVGVCQQTSPCPSHRVSGDKAPQDCHHRRPVSSRLDRSKFGLPLDAADGRTASRVTVHPHDERVALAGAAGRWAGCGVLHSDDHECAARRLTREPEHVLHFHPVDRTGFAPEPTLQRQPLGGHHRQLREEPRGDPSGRFGGRGRHRCLTSSSGTSRSGNQ